MTDYKLDEPDEFEQAGIKLIDEQKKYAYKLASPKGYKDARLIHNIIIFLSSKHKK
jgi:hypothetical protein